MTNDPHITCGATVVMTSGTLIIPSGRRLYVDDHATLTLNAGVICQATGAELIVRPCGRYNNNAGCNIRGETGCLMVEGIYQLGDGLTQQFLDDGFLALSGGEIILGQGSSIVIENSGNSRMEVRQNSTISYGSGSSVTVNGRVDVWDDTQFSIPPNGIVNANAGSFFSMGSGASIYTEGRFHAVGSASNKIQFTSAAGWNGISAQNGNLTTSADLRLEHVEISGASRGVHLKTPLYATITNTTISGVTDMGIEIVPNLSNGGGPNQDVLLDHVAISTNDAYGIVMANTSMARIQWCTVLGPGLTGLYVDNASPTILHSTIKWFDYGVRAITNSAPVFQDGAEGQNGGYNVITENTVGVQCENGSNAVLGLVVQSEDGGQNSIYNNTQYDAALYNECYVYAHNNWWGQPSGPDLNKIVEVGSKLYYDPWLFSDPNGGSAPIRGKTIAATVAEAGEQTEPLSAGVGGIGRAIGQRMRGNHSSAVALLRNIVGSAGESLYVKRWALTELLSNTAHFRANGNSNYLRGLQNQHLLTTVRSTLPATFVEEQNSPEAATEWNLNTRSTSNSLRSAGLYGKFLLALHMDGNVTEASALYNRLRAEHTDAPQTTLAERQLRLARSASAATSLNKHHERSGANVLASASAEKPKAFALEQNYPNPFNPTTTIRFAIPQNEHIMLKVYDLLGREVATLVDESREAGSYEQAFDASQLASGLYIYKLTAGSFSSSKKLMVVK